MELTVSATSAVRDSSPTFTVRMPREVNAGYVGFFDDQLPGPDKEVGSADVHDGVATLTPPARMLPNGSNAIHASYAGDEDKWAPNVSNVVTVMVGVACRRDASVPDPPPGGAVFARPIGETASGPNVVVIDAGQTWSVSSCPGADQAALAELMTHPRAIQVGAGGAVVLRDQPKARSSAWGARDVSFDDPAPVLYPQDSATWKTTNAQAVTPVWLLNNANGCPDCSLPGARFKTLGGALVVLWGYGGDLSGADLRGADFSRIAPSWFHLSFAGANLSGANFDGASLAGADLDHANVSGTTFTGADLRGADLTALRYWAQPVFRGITVGKLPYGEPPRDRPDTCTSFQDAGLDGAAISFSKVAGDCRQVPLFSGSSVSTSVFAAILKDFRGAVNLTGTTVVSGFDNRSALRGVDLSGANLDGVRFTGFPVVLAGAKFDGASLEHASLELADLAGASFVGVNAARASFRGAQLEPSGGMRAANFAGASLQGASFVGADVSEAIFTGANLSDAAFTRALAVDTYFDGVRAPNVDFNRAHIYGNAQAFTSATNLQGADFTNAVLAGSVSNGGGFDLTKTDLTGAKFDGTDCVSCNFTGSKLDQVHFDAAYLPGAVFSGVITLKGANFSDAWLYCGTLANSSCPAVGGKQGRWYWPLALGSAESYGPVAFANTNLSGTSFDEVTACPDGRPPDRSGGCEGHLLPNFAHAPVLPAPCSAAGGDTCPTATSTLYEAGASSALAVAAASPPGWAIGSNSQGYYAAFSDGTIRLIGSGPTKIVAGQAGKKCASATSACGDGGPATRALMGTPAGLAVGLDGSLYIADPALHRLRRIDPAGQISTVAGDGTACTGSGDCGESGAPEEAQLAGPYGVWVDPYGNVYIADGTRGIREVSRRSGTINSIDTHGLDVRSVIGDPNGDLYASTNDPDYLIKISPAGEMTKVVGTGTSGYNGNTTRTGQLAPGTQVQINRPGGLSIGPDGEVIFADTANNLIRAYVPSTGRVIDALGGLVSGGKPQAGFNGDGRWADQTKLNHPASVTLTAGNLYVVADTDNHRVRRFGISPLDEDDVQDLQVHPVSITCTIDTTASTRAGDPTTCGSRPHSRRSSHDRGGLVLATITRRRTLYATGYTATGGEGDQQLVLLELARLSPGRYTLTLRRRHAQRITSKSTSILIDVDSFGS
jgi:uncharacterized protein YjbI with pentapeptide repeats